MKSITVGQLRQNPTEMLADVEAGETYRITRHDREIARVVPLEPLLALTPRKRASGSRLGELSRHPLRTAASIDELLADERDR
jgi:prevent-host-death family protein